MVGVNVIAAETDAEARRLFTSPQQAFTNLLRGTRGQLQPPIDDIETLLDAAREGAASRDARVFLRRLARRRCARGLERFVEETRADEIMVASAIYDHAARLRSYEMLADAFAGCSRGTTHPKS